MHTRLLLALTGALLIVRLPSLVQPLGPDQGIYAYIGERILHGELAYRDAWDQKPPGIHYVYAGLRHLSRRDVVMPGADLACAAMIAALLWTIGARLAGPVAGGLSAIVFLLLSDPSFSRLGGVRVRAQCETFIALAVAGAIANAIGQKPGAWRRLGTLFAGVLIGAAFALKYNAALYGLVALAALAVTGGAAVADIVWVTAGASLIPLALLIVFWRGGAVGDLYQATIVYNLRYSGETYPSRLQMLAYLVRFPVQHARVDALWLIGGVGCLVLLVAGIRKRVLWLPVVWVAVACVSIAINGSRGLPQYFVQAAPALGLAAGVGLVTALAPLPRALRWFIVGLLAFGVWRVADFPKLASNVGHDLRYISGRIDRRTHLARYGGQRDEDKYSALDNLDIGTYLAAHSRPDETVFVFGFSPGSYVYANRRSASRFFWSRPVIYDFNGADPHYGVAGLLADLRTSAPAFVVLQRHDWAPDVEDSEPFFLAQPPLAEWLRANYHALGAGVLPQGFDGWERNGR